MSDEQRAYLVREIKNLQTAFYEKTERLILSLETPADNLPNRTHVSFSLLSPYMLKGQKPVSVLFSDGRERRANTWKEVASVILDDCNADPDRHRRLLELCNMVTGRSRLLFANSPDGMHRPIHVADEPLFFESFFDTETLIKVLTMRILTPAGYDFSGIMIRCRA